MVILYLIAGWFNVALSAFMAWHGDSHAALILSGMALTCWVGVSVEKRNDR